MQSKVPLALLLLRHCCSYDGAGRRHQMETTMQQPLPLAQGGEAGGYRRKGRSGHNEVESAPTPINSFAYMLLHCPDDIERGP